MRVSTRAALAVLVALGLSACAPTSAPSAGGPVEVPVDIDSAPTVITDLHFGTGGGEPLLLDACLPSDLTTQPRAAVILVHGGSWARGDKADPDVRAACEWLAAEGYATFSINYRLAPTSTFPAPLGDVQAAVRWVRMTEQVARFGLDPDRIGLFGASAGGHLAALAGVSGEGDWMIDARVAAVVDLSGPSDLRAAIPTTAAYTGDFAQAQLDLLGCAVFAGCVTADAASVTTHIDATDPPFFVAHSRDEFIPITQSQLLVDALVAQSVPVTWIPMAGSAHALELLDDAMKKRIADFLAGALRQ